MKKRSLIPLTLTCGATLLCGLTANAQFQSYSENFDTDNSANWQANPGSSGNHAADFFFDYSTVGIPSAPHSSGGSTRGMKLMANFGPNAPGTAYGISASPVGLNLQGDYEVHFDMWCNFNGPAPGGGSGSTQLTGGGIGSSGTYANYPGRADGIWMAVTGDGGSTDDYRVYSPAFATSYQYNSDGGVYASGTATTTRNSSTPYWTTNFPGVTIPATQTALFAQQTGTTAAGAQAFKWRDVMIRKSGNQAVFYIDDILMATVNMDNAGTLGGGDLLFMQADINATISTDANRQALLFGLIDNIRVTNLASVVSVSATINQVNESGGYALFSISRSEPDLSAPRTVNFTLTGTATNGVDYTTVPLSATIPSGASGVDVAVTPINDSISEFEESIVMTLAPGTGYSIGSPSSATATILDDDAPMVGIETYRPTAYERVGADYITYRLYRKGDLSGGFDVNINYSGATSRVTPVNTVTIDPSVVYAEFNVSPVDNSLLDGNGSVTATVASGAGYSVDSVKPSATATILDDELPAAPVLFSDNFNSAAGTGWAIKFAADNGIDDYTATFGYDYLANNSIPAAPHGSDTTGLFVTVNKNDAVTGAAGVNLYPVGQSFSGDYAVRFDMYMQLSSGATTEYALMGINHSGAKTNWMRLNSAGYTNSSYDGIFASVEADASGSEDYLLMTSPVVNNGGFWTPTRLVTTDARAFTNVFKSPPFYSVQGGTQPGGSPANFASSTTPTWVDVEMSQIQGVVTLKMNQTVIMKYTNTTAYTSGAPMLGYDDAFASIGTGGFVIYDNFRVVNLDNSVTVTGIQVVGGNVEITFKGNASDTIGSFTLQQTGNIGTSFGDTSSSISALGGGNFKAVKALNGPSQFYRIRRN